MYTDELWQQWSAKEESNYIVKDGKRTYLKKGYLHFDYRFWFPEEKDKLRKILKDNLFTLNSKTKRRSYWAFDPFIKMLLKTPRYKYHEDEDSFEIDTKIRPISFASHIDSLILGFYAFCLNKKYEEYIKLNHFDECVLAYRTDLGKCNIQFSKEVFDYIKNKGECTAIALDIKGYFDNIDHKILKEKWSKLLGGLLPEDQYRIYRILTKYSYVSKRSILRKYNIDLKKQYKINTPSLLLDFIPGNTHLEKFEKLRTDNLIVINDKQINERGVGIPQGSSMSALLSNIYLMDYDKLLHEKAQDEGFLYRRYCDDILIVCDSDKAEAIQQFAIDNISGENCLLPIQDKKIELIEFAKNSKGIIRSFNKKKILKDQATLSGENEKKYYRSLQYLGFEYNGKNILIRSSSLSRFYKKMVARVKKTVAMAYANNAHNHISKEQLFRKYTYIGERNFLTYAYNASKKEYKNSQGNTLQGMDSKPLKKQLRRHFEVLMQVLTDKNEHLFKIKQRKGGIKNIKTL